METSPSASEQAGLKAELKVEAAEGAAARAEKPLPTDEAKEPEVSGRGADTEVTQDSPRPSKLSASPPQPSTSSSAQSPKLETKDQKEAPSEPVEATPFSPAAAALAISNAASVASNCRTPGDPSGEAKITITFASSGKVTQALLSGPPFAGTKTGSCIAEQFRQAEVPAFSGKRITMNKTVTIR
jgi:hypothetical protein